MRARPEYWANAFITHKMADSRRLNWEILFASLQGSVRKVLEIGSYEGQSALFWLHFFDAHVTCIDTWENVAEGCSSGQEVEAHFDRNVRGLLVTKIKLKSTLALADMVEAGATFDLIYVDGDHSRLQVMIDSCLGWRLLRPGGFMVWDDYLDYRPDLADRPELAIDAFVAMMTDEAMIYMNTGQQLVARKK